MRPNEVYILSVSQYDQTFPQRCKNENKNNVCFFFLSCIVKPSEAANNPIYGIAGLFYFHFLKIQTNKKLTNIVNKLH